MGDADNLCTPLWEAGLSGVAFFYLDSMHCMDCKGVASMIFGGCIASWIARPALGPNKAARLKEINQFLTSWYDANPGRCRLPKIEESSVFLNHWADLHGPNIKAASTRQAAPIFHAMALHWAVAGSEEDALLVEVTGRLAAFYTVLADSPMFMSIEQKAELADCCQGMALAIQRLRQMGQGRGLLHWPVRPKTHKMCHFAFLVLH